MYKIITFNVLFLEFFLLFFSQKLVAECIFDGCENTYYYESLPPSNCELYKVTCYRKNNFFTFQFGYRQDYLRWNISGYNNFPNILSELTWEDVDCVEFGFFGNYTLCNYYFRGEGSYARAFNGKIQDSDYHLDDRHDEFSRSYSCCNSGNLLYVSLAIGTRFQGCIKCYEVEFMPIGGLSCRVNDYNISDGRQIIALDIETNEPIYVDHEIVGLNSSYRFNIFSGFLGGDFKLSYYQTMFGFFSFEYHFANYCARGHWNLRHDFLDGFCHSSVYGNGVRARLEIDYLCNCRYLFGFFTSFTYFDLDGGYDHGISLVGNEEGGVEEVPFVIPFRSACFKSFSVGASIGQAF